MPDFAYVARESNGQQVSGMITAANETDALSSLSTQKLFPIRLDLADSSRIQQKQALKRVAAGKLAVFYSQLADLLRSGVPLLRSLALLERQTSSPSLKGVLNRIHERVAEGTSLAESLAQHPKAFSPLVVSMVQAGEEGGFLEDVLQRIADLTEHQEELKSRILGAMVYPAFLLVAGGLIVIVMLVGFVPQFEPIFERLKEQNQLPAATTILMGLSSFVQQYWLIVLVLIGSAIYGCGHWLKTEKGRKTLDEYQLKIIGLGTLCRNLAIARFSRMLGTLLHNGVPIIKSLNIAKDATGNSVLSEAVGSATENLTAGKALAQPLAQSGEFPEEIVEMIAVGEESNNLENVLIDIANNLERRSNRTMEVAVNLIGPLMILLMGGIVLFIAIALLMPILQSSGVI